jgi:membrane protease YdiL (CAAX protease family)
VLAGILQSAIVLGIVAPFAVAALLTTRNVRERRWLAVTAVLFFVAGAAGRLPFWRWGGWNWGGKLAVVAVLAAFLAIVRRPAREMGLLPPAPGSWRPALGGTAVAMLLPMVGVVAGWHSRTDLATWLFQPTLPGLTEELEVRGIEQGLLDRTFGRPWTILGARMGWGAVLPQLAWALMHAVRVDREAHVRIFVVNMLPPLFGGWILAWMRARTESIWPAVLAHGLANELVVAGAALRAQ